MLIASIIISVLLMFAVPILLILFLTWRFQTTWRVAGVGAIAYLVSQSLLMLIAWGLQTVAPSLVTASQTDANAANQLTLIFTVLTAVVEVVALWVAFRYLKKDGDSWGGALTVGMGFAGAESILIGVEYISTYYPVVVSVLFGVAAAGLTADQATQMTAILPAFLATAWYMPFISTLVRLSNMALALVMAIIIWQSRYRKQWWLAIGAAVWMIIVQMAYNYVAGISADSFWPEVVLLLGIILNVGALLWFKYRVADHLTMPVEPPDDPEPGVVDAEGKSLIAKASKPRKPKSDKTE